MRTFIKLGEDERTFLRDLQAVHEKMGGKKPPMDAVIRSVINDYRRVLEANGEPDFLAALRNQTNRC